MQCCFDGRRIVVFSGGAAKGEDSVISDGLTPGESVVTDGQMRLKPGMAVDIKTAEEPKTRP